MLRISRESGDRVCLIRFEDLIHSTETVMRHLSEFLEISFEDILLKPTFNSLPLKQPEGRRTNTFDVPADYASDSRAIDEDHRVLVREMTQADYQAVLREAADIY